MKFLPSIFGQTPAFILPGDDISFALWKHHVYLLIARDVFTNQDDYFLLKIAFCRLYTASKCLMNKY